MAEPRKITINPVSRLEGHGKVVIHLDAERRGARSAIPRDPVQGVRAFL